MEKLSFPERQITNRRDGVTETADERWNEREAFLGEIKGPERMGSELGWKKETLFTRARQGGSRTRVYRGKDSRETQLPKSKLFEIPREEVWYHGGEAQLWENLKKI